MAQRPGGGRRAAGALLLTDIAPEATAVMLLVHLHLLLLVLAELAAEAAAGDEARVRALLRAACGGRRRLVHWRREAQVDAIRGYLGVGVRE